MLQIIIYDIIIWIYQRSDITRLLALAHLLAFGWFVQICASNFFFFQHLAAETCSCKTKLLVKCLFTVIICSSISGLHLQQIFPLWQTWLHAPNTRVFVEMSAGMSINPAPGPPSWSRFNPLSSNTNSSVGLTSCHRVLVPPDSKQLIVVVAVNLFKLKLLQRDLVSETGGRPQVEDNVCRAGAVSH